MKRAIAILLVAAACGSGDKSTDCRSDLQNFKACGGDLNGTWKPLVSCTSAVSQNPFSAKAGCETAGITPASISMSGTVTFKDGTETDDLTATAAEKVNLPLSCLQALGTADASPQQICTDLSAQFTGDGVTGSCTFAPAACTCAVSVTVKSTGSNTYKTSDNHIISADAPAGTVGSGYCVEGGRLLLQESTSTPGILAEFEH